MVMSDRNVTINPLYKILVFGWFCAFIFSPFYVFDSGLPQPADFLLIGVCGFTLLLGFLHGDITYNNTVILTLTIVLMFGTINIANGLYYGDVRFYYSCAYYVFNAAVLGGTVLLFKNNPDRMTSYVRVGVFASVLLQIAFIIFTGGTDIALRETGSFNNPNQLGYWALLNALILFVINCKQKLSVTEFILFVLCGVIIMLSQSRAAIVAYVLFIPFIFWGKQINLPMKAAIIGAVFIGFVTFFFAPVIDHRIEDYDGLFQHYFLRNDGLSFIAERGYQRIIENPHHLLIGAGEGAYWRFSDIEGGGIELHSGLATVLFSYGVLGLGVFCAFLYSIFRKSPMIVIVTLAMVIIYGLTHQNIRFTGFWIYLAVVYGVTRFQLSPSQDKNDNR